MQKVCTYHYPTTIQGRLATYQILRSSYQHSNVDVKKNNKSNKQIVEPARSMSSLKISNFSCDTNRKCHGTGFHKGSLAIINLPQDVASFVHSLPHMLSQLDIVVIRREGNVGSHKNVKVRWSRVLCSSIIVLNTALHMLLL